MTCTEIHDQLLEADTSTLRGEGESAVAHHLQSCPRCRQLAERIVAEESSLQRALAALEPQQSVDGAVRAAVAHARRRRRRRWVVASGLAAAAVAAFALWQSGRSALPPSPPPTTMAQPFVQTRADQNVIVYQTANPDIVVVWLYQRNGS